MSGRISEEIDRRIESAKWHQANGYPYYAAANIDAGYEALRKTDETLAKSLRNKLNMAIDEIAEM